MLSPCSCLWSVVSLSLGNRARGLLMMLCPVRRVTSSIGIGNPYGSPGFSSSLAESESASVVVYFEGESGSGMQAELMVPDRSEITPASIFWVPAPRSGFLPLGPGSLPPGLGPASGHGSLSLSLGPSFVFQTKLIPAITTMKMTFYALCSTPTTPHTGPGHDLQLTDRDTPCSSKHIEAPCSLKHIDYSTICSGHVPPRTDVSKALSLFLRFSKAARGVLVLSSWGGVSLVLIFHPSLMAAVASLCLIGIRFPTLRGFAYLTVFGGACKAYASYPGDNARIPGILGNKENLTFERFSLMAENDNRFQRILRTS
ncbi:hypothetical protein F2Q69_00007645 [Brassica cretica]|uniref:Uncharacterized protein n=1 Tax=Brassica cretica TaxID=69181 RepID=A0A8S9P3B7_BRACR|nr:hypothetical protein F2Q69_00007645 [Brassica cretica]